MPSIKRLKSKLLSAKPRWLILGLAAIFVLLLLIVGLRLIKKPVQIRNFDECAAAGYPIQEKYPPVCSTPDGKSFTQKVVDQPTGEQVTARPFTILVSGGPSKENESKNVVIKSQAEWDKLWVKTYGSIDTHPQIRINFAKEMVIGVFSGTKPNGGHYTKVTSIDESAAKIIVNVLEVEPGKGCIVTMALTTPHYVVSTPTSTKPVEFSVTHKTQDCTSEAVQP